MPQQSFIAGAPALLELSCPEGIPSAATVEIFHPASGSLSAAQAATLPTATATLTAAASEYAGSFEVSGGDQLTPGTRALAQSTAGDRLEVTVLSASPSVVQLAESLPFAMPLGSTIRDRRVTYDAGAALERARGYRAKWTLTLGGAEVVKWTAFDVVHQPFDVPLTAQDIVGAWPALRNRLDDSWPDLKPSCLRFLRGWLMTQGHTPDRLRDLDAFVEPAAYWYAYQYSKDPTGGKWFDERIMARLEKDLNAALKRAIKAQGWVDHNDNDKRDETEPQPGHSSNVWDGFLPEDDDEEDW